MTTAEQDANCFLAASVWPNHISHNRVMMTMLMKCSSSQNDQISPFSHIPICFLFTHQILISRSGLVSPPKKTKTFWLELMAWVGIPNCKQKQLGPGVPSQQAGTSRLLCRRLLWYPTPLLSITNKGNVSKWTAGSRQIPPLSGIAGFSHNLSIK